jgi:sugar lactone lactonase YvrE
MRLWAWILSLLLAGCSWKLPGLVPLSRDVPLTLSIGEEQLLAAGERTSLKVTIEATRLQALPDAWDQAEVTLGHASLLASNQTRTASQAGGSAVSLIFTGLPPGAGYTLTVNLYANKRLKAQGRKDGISLAAGGNAVNVSMTLAPWVIQRVAGIGIEGSPASKAVIEPVGKVAVDGAGNLYLGNKALFRVFKVDPSGIMTTVAGNGGGGSNGDGAHALLGAVLNPASLVLDGAGNLYFADPSAHRVRKVAPDGIITTVAGNGSQGYLGDGGPANATRLNVPEDVAVDAAGNLYIADKENHRIRKVDPSGTITTVAGNGSGGFGGDGGAATDASLYYPSGVTVDGAGNLYLADTSNQRIRRVDAATGTITTVAGTGTAGFGGDGGLATEAKLSYPTGVAVDGAGNLYLADKNNHRIRRVDAADETISTVAGTGTGNYHGDGGPATDAWLWEPGGVTLDATGNLYITDRTNRRVRKVDAATGVISTVAGSGNVTYEGDGGLGTSAKVNSPRGLALDNLGNLYIADTGNHRIRKLEPSGLITTVAGGGPGNFGGDGGAATAAALRNPAAVAVDTAGNLYIADSSNHRIRKVDAGTGVITTVAGNGTAGFGGDGGLATAANLSNPQGVAVDPHGNLYIGDYNNHRVRKVDPSGIITTVAGNGTSAYAGDSGAGPLASLSQPAGLAVDGEGNLYIADSGNGKIRKVDPSGIITSVSGIGTSLNHAVAVDGSGNLYVAETYSHRIRKRDPLGNVTVIAGSSPGSSLDGGDPTLAKILYPRGVAANGEVYLSDSHNHCIRRLF